MTSITIPRPTQAPQPIERGDPLNSDLDYQFLDKELDKVKTKVFLGSNAAFLGSISSQLPFTWSSDIESACTNGLSLWWNPYWFLKLPEKTRRTVLVHELWHVALLHCIRIAGRDPDRWNRAADIAINNMLDLEGYSFEGLGFKPCLDHAYGTMSAEEIYDELTKLDEAEWEAFLKKFGLQEDDILPPQLGGGENADMEVISKVVQAHQVASMSGAADQLPGSVERVLKRFLSPKIPWQRELSGFMEAFSDVDYSMGRPNRRYRHLNLTLPSLQNLEGLEDLAYFWDVSGSIREADEVRFNSEMKYVKELFQPELLRIIQFDTIIQKIDSFTPEDPFDEIKIQGKGGTSLVCVRDWILEHKPRAVVIFSDLRCRQMDCTDIDCPILWVAINHHNAEVQKGRLIHIRE